MTCRAFFCRTTPDRAPVSRSAIRFSAGPNGWKGLPVREKSVRYAQQCDHLLGGSLPSSAADFAEAG